VRLLQQAGEQHRAGQLSRADQLCSEVLQLSPASAEAMHLRGVIAGQQGDYELAVKWMRRAIRMSPQLVQAYNNLGLFLQPLARRQEAEHSFREALRRSPQYAEVHNNLANLLLASGRAEDAITHYRQAALLQPRYADAHFNLGLALQKTGEVRGASESLRKAVALRPGWAAARQALAVAEYALGDVDAAQISFQKALAIEPRLPEAHNGLGNVCFAQGRLAEALAFYDDAIRLDPDCVEAYQNRGLIREELDQPSAALCDYQTAADARPGFMPALLGMARVHQARGEFLQAEALYRRVIAQDDGNVDAYVGLLGCKRIEERDRPVLEQMASLLDPDLPAEKQALLHGALGRAYDRLEEYPRAFEHFAAAKNTRPRDVFDRRAHADDITARIKFYCEPAPVAARRVACSSELPVFVVGMPRSGTTLVEQILAGHPQIATVGESPFWARYESEMYGTGWHRFDQAADEDAGRHYVQMMTATNPSALRVVDKLTTNFLRLGMLVDALPGARVVHCCRNPLDTCLSVYFTQFRGGHPYAADLADIGFYYREYNRLMAHWRSILPDDALYKVQYEQLVTDVEHTARRLIDFLGLPWNEQCLAFQHNSTAIRTASKWQVRQPVYTHSMDRWRHYRRFIGPLMDELGVLT
jgi:tetratricopeptide (TPR) repeat protein